MKKYIIIPILFLVIVSCTDMTDSLSGPASLQYLVLSERDNASTATTLNTKYSQETIIKELFIRNTSKDSKSYKVYIEKNNRQVFKVMKGYDTITSCFAGNELYIDLPATVVLKPGQQCTFNFTAYLEDNFTDINNTNIANLNMQSLSALLKVDDGKSIDEYPADVTLVMSLPIQQYTSLDGISDNISRNKMIKRVFFGNVLYDSAIKSRLFYFDNASNKTTEQKVLVAKVDVGSDKNITAIDFTFSQYFTNAFKIDNRTTCNVEYFKNDEYTRRVEVSTTPCFIFLKFEPNIYINYTHYISYTLVNENRPIGNKTVLLMLEGNKDNMTYLPVTMNAEQGGKTVGTHINIDNLTVTGGNILTKPPKEIQFNFVHKYIDSSDKIATGNPLDSYAPLEIQFFNIENVSDTLNKGFLISLLLSADLFDKKIKSSSISSALVSARADNNTLAKQACTPLSTTSFILRNTSSGSGIVPYCSVYTKFLADFFKLSDNGTELQPNICTTSITTNCVKTDDKDRFFGYLVETNYGSIPLTGAYSKTKGDNTTFFYNDKDVYFLGMIDNKSLEDTDNGTLILKVPIELNLNIQTAELEFIDLGNDGKAPFYFIANDNSLFTSTLVKDNTTKIPLISTAGKEQVVYIAFKKRLDKDTSRLDTKLGGNFALINLTEKSINPSDDSNRNLFIYAQVLNSVPVDNKSTSDNISITFKRNLSQPSREYFAIEFDNKSNYDVEFSRDFSRVFQIMPSSTCKINYSTTTFSYDPATNNNINRCYLIVTPLATIKDINSAKIFVRKTPKVKPLPNNSSTLKTYSFVI